MSTTFKLASAACVAAMVFATAATQASAGTVFHPNLSGTRVDYTQMFESGSDVPSGGPGLYIPGTPTVGDSPDPFINFVPSGLAAEVQGAFDIDTNNSTLSFVTSGKTVNNVPGIIGYAMTGMELQLGGLFQVNYWVPFASSEFQYAQTVNYTVKVTGVNFAPYSSASSLTSAMTLSSSSGSDVGPKGGFQQVSWTGSALVDWNALRASAGLSVSDHVTSVQLLFSPQLGAATLNGAGSNAITSLTVATPIAPVPEPSTMVLAGLGAAALVVTGYRRRRKAADSTMPVAIALAA